MAETLPDFLQAFFWDTNFAGLSWERQGDFIIRRVLQAGSWEAVTWLRGQLGDAALREWIEEKRGGGMSPRQMRFWGLMLDLPEDEVTGWVRAEQETSWGRRMVR